MTKLSSTTRAVRRETAAALRGKKLIVELGPHALAIRVKGGRRKFELAYEAIYWLGAKQEAERQLKERAGNRRRGRRRK